MVGKTKHTEATVSMLALILPLEWALKWATVVDETDELVEAAVFLSN